MALRWSLNPLISVRIRRPWEVTHMNTEEDGHVKTEQSVESWCHELRNSRTAGNPEVKRGKEGFCP